MGRSVQLISASVIILTGALLWLRVLTPNFDPAISAQHHPAYLLSAIIVVAASAWFFLFLTLRQTALNSKILLPILLLCGLVLRLAFFESQSVYENDYKRYLWDGAVTASLENPYIYSPAQVFEASQPGTASAPSLAHLAVMSNQAGGITGEINSPVLTTIYPPAAQAVFAAAYWIAPFKKWGLQLVFLIAETLGLICILLGLKARALPLIWSALYWLNPVIIFTTYNGIHMDVLLLAPLMGALLCLNKYPLRAAILLSLAAAIKIWPLLLAPILFQNYWQKRRALYIGIAALISALTLISLAPMLLALNEQSGLAAYSANWTNSSFLFPGLRDFLAIFIDNADRVARYMIAAALTLLSLWFGFIAKPAANNTSSQASLTSNLSSNTITAQLMILTGAFVFLSPTGYPWYFIWFLMFLPFNPHHWSARGLAFLTIGAAVYFARFKIGETGHYVIYERILLPLEFGLALLILTRDGWTANKGKINRGRANNND